MKQKKIFITGGTGFVGKHLQEELAQRGIEYFAFSSKEYDLTVKEQAEAAFAGHQDVDVIIHLASFQGAGDFPAKHPAEQFNINNSIHLNVLEGWRKYAPHAKFIGIGSSCGYPSGASALTEDKFMDGEIHESVQWYAFTKRLLFAGITAYNNQYGLNGTYLIPATMYGEYDDFDVAKAHVCGALIGKFVTAVREDLPTVEIWGDGSQVREFMYVKDFIRALLHLIPLCERDIVNVGPGRGITIKALGEAIKDAAGFEGSIFYNTDRYVGIKEKFMDATNLAKNYHWQVDDSLSEPIQRTVAWFSQKYQELKVSTYL